MVERSSEFSKDCNITVHKKEENEDIMRMMHKRDPYKRRIISKLMKMKQFRDNSGQLAEQ